MPKTNAERMADYRRRHLQDSATVDSAAIHVVVPIGTKRALERLARHAGATQRDTLVRLVDDAESTALGTMTGPEQEAYRA